MDDLLNDAVVKWMTGDKEAFVRVYEYSKKDVNRIVLLLTSSPQSLTRLPEQIRQPR